MPEIGDLDNARLRVATTFVGEELRVLHAVNCDVLPDQVRLYEVVRLGHLDPPNLLLADATGGERGGCPAWEAEEGGGKVLRIASHTLCKGGDRAWFRSHDGDRDVDVVDHQISDNPVGNSIAVGAHTCGLEVDRRGHDALELHDSRIEPLNVAHHKADFSAIRRRNQLFSRLDPIGDRFLHEHMNAAFHQLESD